MIGFQFSLCHLAEMLTRMMMLDSKVTLREKNLRGGRLRIGLENVFLPKKVLNRFTLLIIFAKKA